MGEISFLCCNVAASAGVLEVAGVSHWLLATLPISHVTGRSRQLYTQSHHIRKLLVLGLVDSPN